MEILENKKGRRKVRPMRLFIYCIFIALGVHGAIQIFSTPPSTNTATEIVAPVSTSSTTVTTTIVAFGDSVTAGYGIALDRAYPRILETLLTDTGYSVRVVNAGVSG